MSDLLNLSNPVHCWSKKEGFFNVSFSQSKYLDIKESNYLNAVESIKTNNLYASIESKTNDWLIQACESAYQSVIQGGGPFGAIITQVDAETNKVLRYWQTTNKVTQHNDPTAHAEVLGIRSACHSLGVFNLGSIKRDDALLDQPGENSFCKIYSSCEPCPMCYSAIFWARIPELYFAATRFDAEVPGVDFSDSEIYKELDTPYSDRKIKVHQCDTPNSLNAFNLWKNSNTVQY